MQTSEMMCKNATQKSTGVRQDGETKRPKTNVKEMINKPIQLIAAIIMINN